MPVESLCKEAIAGFEDESAVISSDAFDVEPALDEPAPSHARISLKTERLSGGPEQDRRSRIRSRQELPTAVIIPAGK